MMGEYQEGEVDEVWPRIMMMITDPVDPRRILLTNNLNGAPMVTRVSYLGSQNLGVGRDRKEDKSHHSS